MNPLEFPYYIGYLLKKSYGLKHRKRLPCKVISVGNLTVGGTGKTPAVIAIAEEGKNRGYHPCILTRGYKGSARGPCFVGRGNGALLGAEEAGDEAALMAGRLKGVPVVKGADRYEAGMFALRELSPLPSDRSRLVFILDDGFQHWKLYRQRDILLIDSTCPFGNSRLLPWGRLREPVSGMRRADVIVITKAQQGTEQIGNGPSGGLVEKIKGYNPEVALYIARHSPVCLTTVSGREIPLDALDGRPVLGFCGLGNPASFKDTLERVRADVKEFQAFRDHHEYGSGDIARIRKAAEREHVDWIVTTEKDIMRLKDFDLGERLVSLRIEFEVGHSFYDRIFAED
ncbi:MAG: tetraacyldisaccharide 4'-kinase [Nitrospirae bacterium]|nr:tetraacyldisaccharide 4'-kinase [Nitrospirota bacterium]